MNKETRIALLIVGVMGIFALGIVNLLIATGFLTPFTYAHQILPRTTDKVGFPSNSGAPLSATDRDEFIYALAGGALSRNTTTQTLLATGDIDCDDWGIVLVEGNGGDVTLDDPVILDPTDQPTTKLCLVQAAGTNRVIMTDGSNIDLNGRASITISTNAGDVANALFVFNGTDWDLIATSSVSVPNLWGTDITGAVTLGDNPQEMHGKYYLFTVAATATLAAAATVGYGATACFMNDAAQAVVVDIQAGEKVNLDGTALAAGTGITTSAAGEKVCMVATTDTDTAGTDGYIAWGNTSGWASQ